MHDIIVQIYGHAAQDVDPTTYHSLPSPTTHTPYSNYDHGRLSFHLSMAVVSITALFRAILIVGAKATNASCKVRADIPPAQYSPGREIRFICPTVVNISSQRTWLSFAFIRIKGKFWRLR